MGVLDPQLLCQDEEGDHNHNGSEHISAQDEPCNLFPASVLVAGEAIGPGSTNHHRQQNCQTRHLHTVPEIGEEVSGGEETAEVVPCSLMGDE